MFRFPERSLQVRFHQVRQSRLVGQPLGPLAAAGALRTLKGCTGYQAGETAPVSPKSEVGGGRQVLSETTEQYARGRRKSARSAL